MSHDPSADTKSGKRRYSKPTPEIWRECVGYFLSGAYTLPELSARYAVSTRAIQFQAAKARTASAAKAAPIVATFTSASTAATKLTKATAIECIKETRASAYADAVALQAQIGSALAALSADPGIPPTARLRALDGAAVALDRVTKLRRLLLGITKDDEAADRALPDLPIRVLTDEEVRAMRENQAREDGEMIEPGGALDSADGVMLLDDGDDHGAGVVIED